MVIIMKATDLKLKEIHLFEEKGEPFLYDVFEMNLYHLERECYDFLQALQNGEPVSSGTDEDMLQSLIDSGILFDPETTEPEALPQYEKLDTYPVKNVVLEMANDCNLNCKYCYGEGGGYGRKKELMTFDTAKAAIDMVLNNTS